MPAAASLFLITGFLGSGKTTVLNGILASLAGKRVGVIVNEWGKIGVDGRLLADPTGLGVVEVAGGQIFCSCVSGSFIAAAARLASFDLDYLLVETSGLAKPAVLGTIISEAERRSGGRLSYRGMICVVDALRFAVIRQAAMVVDEQVAYSDLFILTKTDLADSRTVAETRRILSELRPGGRVSEAINGNIDASLLPSAAGIPSSAPDPRFSGWGAAGRPGTTAVVPSAPVSAGALQAFLESVVPDAYRVKGFVEFVDGTSVLVDCVGDQVVLRKVGNASADEPGKGCYGLVIVWKAAPPAPDSGTESQADRAERAWEAAVGTPALVD